MVIACSKKVSAGQTHTHLEFGHFELLPETLHLPGVDGMIISVEVPVIIDPKDGLIVCQ